MPRKVFIIILICSLLTSCSDRITQGKGALQNEKDIAGQAELLNKDFENLDLPEGYNIRQFEGLTLNFVVENNLYANILTHESEEFSQLTGINIKIRPVDFDTLVQKVNLDFIAQAGEYQIIYVDPYQTLNRFYDYLEILNPYNEDPDLPGIKGFMDDFVDSQTTVCSYFEEENNVYTIPFDSTTMILYYRKDILTSTEISSSKIWVTTGLPAPENSHGRGIAKLPGG